MAGTPRRRYEFAVLVLIIGVLALLLLQALERARREIEELKRQNKALEKEKRVVEIEREILKKAAAFFARESQ